MMGPSSFNTFVVVLLYGHKRHTMYATINIIIVLNEWNIQVTSSFDNI